MHGDVADAVEVGNRCAAEFQHQQGHDSSQQEGRPIFGPAGKIGSFILIEAESRNMALFGAP
jgi:hypothetical protein